ncbi:glycosyltransferase [Rahnella aceris]|uniref:glycosyltransferase n=1 Tax=Rahnella sp. (strain Y9602) TaxID=2703885 RepID=UPI001C25B467|nr:glycosyltransferase [Rahnella aceris]MBU9859732.1 glycosyltransferase [Rahnella aceris]
MKKSDLLQTLSTHGFSLNETTGIWCQSSENEFAYNDGDEAENYVLDVVTQAKDLSVYSSELSQKMKDWPSTYHLISRRSNLLFPFKEWFAGKRVLEIGCGCGAITRFLGETCGEVVSVEGSRRRAQIARTRCRDLENVTIISAPSDQLPDIGEFDAVLLIGVLEYARVFLGPEGQQLLLTDCYKRLGAQGKFFLAIENQLGLKYFAGANEDHVAKPMFGINNSYSDSSVVTFGRHALKQQLTDTGFEQIEEYLPLPDYKMPVTIVTPMGWKKFASELSTMALETAHQDLQRTEYPLFSLEMATKTAWQNGLAADVSNSFLMVSSKSPNSIFHEHVAALHISDGRAVEFNKLATFLVSDEGALQVINQPLVNIGEIETTHEAIEKETPFIHGESLWEDLLKLLNRPDWTRDQLLVWIRGWLNSLLDELSLPIVYSKEMLLPAKYQDGLPFNAIRNSDGKIVYFDLEWNIGESVSLGYVAYRGVYHSLFRLSSISALPKDLEGSVYSVTCQMLSDIGFENTQEDYLAYLQQDADFMALIQGKHDSSTIVEALKYAPFLVRENLSHSKQLLQELEEENASVRKKEQELVKLLEAREEHMLEMEYAHEEEILKYQHSIQNYSLQLAEVYASSSWKLTYPLRALGRQRTIRKFKQFHFAIHKMKSIAKLVKNSPQYAHEMGGWKMLSLALFRLLKKEGVGGIISRARGKVNQAKMIMPAQSRADYAEWVALYGTFDDEKRADALSEIAKFPSHPVISIVMPTYNPPVELLSEAIDSVIAQAYPYWELCIADDASPDQNVQAVLRLYEQKDKRIKICLREQNGHISAASNSALNLATGHYVALLDHDDILPADALFEVAKAILANPEAKMFYSDEDKIDPQGIRCHPYFKPDWNPDLFYSQNMFSHLGVYDRDLLNEIGGFRLGTEGSQDYDLALRCLEKVGHNAVTHIPKILYHWRIIPGSTAASGGEKPYAFLASMKVLGEHFQRQGIKAEVSEAVENMRMMRVKYSLPENPPLVSIIIPTRNGEALVRQCLESIFEKSTYKNYEIILIDNGSTDAGALAYFAELDKKPNVFVLHDDSPFNYSALNNKAATSARGELICLLNNDIEVISPDWLEELVSQAMRPEIGAVGARLWYPDDTLQHGGVVIGMGGIAGHAHLGISRENPGYFGRAWLTQNYSAVTAACLMIRKSTYFAVNGLEEEHLTVAFNDVDFCIRVRDAGYRNLWTPFAELYHHESATRGNDLAPDKIERFKREIAYMEQQHGHQLNNDPAFNPNLDLMNNHFSIAFPPRKYLD